MAKNAKVMSVQDPTGPGGAPVPVLAQLSGRRRGMMERLSGDTLRLIVAPEAGVLVVDAAQAETSGTFATLRRAGLTYLLEVDPNRAVWVNGQRAHRALLVSGDVIEVGDGGPVLRFRLYTDGTGLHKSLREVFADCIECVRHDQGGRLSRTSLFLATMGKELRAQTRGRMRFLGAALTVLAFAIAAVAWQGLAVRESVETRSGAGMRLVAKASRSVVFLQASYGFVERKSGRPLRYSPTGPGLPGLPDAPGNAVFTLDGEGTLMQVDTSGTAFVATPEGLLLTNRHVAMPWENDSTSKALVARGFEPVIRRFVGYLPGFAKPFDVRLLRVSENADLAVLQCDNITGRVPSLELRQATAKPGEPIIVLGYPTGLQALLARADKPFIDRLVAEKRSDFWTVAADLSQAGYIKPLATRGIVGQVSDAAVAYDAGSTHGSSGGPVLTLDGQVVGISVAILRDFSGSNLGVPVSYGRKLLQEVGE